MPLSVTIEQKNGEIETPRIKAHFAIPYALVIIRICDFTGLHFHLAASINAETDIPLVPSLAGGGRFILHWLHNKEMHFTSQAEAILHDLTKKVR